MLHNIVQHHFLCNIGFVVIVASMGIDLKYNNISCFGIFYMLCQCLFIIINSQMAIIS